MGMQLNIKNDEAYQMAARLAALTGESMTTAVTEALRERLERQSRQHDRDERLRRVRAITADIRRHMREPLPTSDHDWMYDDHGLPR